MKLLVATRRRLIDRAPAADQPALLLEGAWPAGSEAPGRWSLDEAIDRRFAWIDREAAETAQRLLEHDGPRGDGPADYLSPLAVDALDLRYYLVKLLRVVAWFTGVRPLGRNDQVELVAQRDRDEDYAQLLAELCRLPGAALNVGWRDGPAPQPPVANNGMLRRWAARLLGVLGPRLGRSGHPRVVLCGNPRLLDLVCRELLSRDARVWWLYDRFALRSWAQWRWRGVGQLVCNASLGRHNGLTGQLPERVVCHSVNLAGALRHWLDARQQQSGPRHTRLVQQIERHFSRLKPDVVLLDEDATPLARIAVELARRQGASSAVLQHGAPCCRFGFSPLAADRILVWGRSARNQLMRWEVPGDRIVVTGSPYHDQLRARLRRLAQKSRKPRSAPRLLLLATVPPRDERPDAITLHLTGRSYAATIDAAFAAISRIPRSRLLVKLHPRAADDPAVRAAAARFPQLPTKIITAGPLDKLLNRVDCVISCGSSAGVDATLSGLPVIQLLPHGAQELLSEDPWGFAGIARNAAELEHAVTKALSTRRSGAFTPDPSIFGKFEHRAAGQIAETVLGLRKEEEKGKERERGTSRGRTTKAVSSLPQFERACR